MCMHMNVRICTYVRVVRMHVRVCTYERTCMYIRVCTYECTCSRYVCTCSIFSSLLRDNIDMCSKFLLNTVNFGITNSTFDNGMKYADIALIFKTDESIRKENYRPISCLSAGSKNFEKILQKQIATYIETYLGPFICGYRKGQLHNMQL